MASAQRIPVRTIQVIGFSIPVALGWWGPWIDPTSTTPFAVLAVVLIASVLAGSWWALIAFPAGYVGAAFTRVVIDDQVWVRLINFVENWDGSTVALVTQLLGKAIAVAWFAGVAGLAGAGLLMAAPIAAGLWLRSRTTALSSPRLLSYRN